MTDGDPTVDRTVILLDWDVLSNASSTSSIQIDFRRGGPREFTMQPSHLSFCIEGALSYLRLLFDLFPEDGRAMIMIPTPKGTKRLGSWNPDDQVLWKIQQKIESLSNLDVSKIFPSTSRDVHQVDDAEAPSAPQRPSSSSSASAQSDIDPSATQGSDAPKDVGKDTRSDVEAKHVQELPLNPPTSSAKRAKPKPPSRATHGPAIRGVIKAISDPLVGSDDTTQTTNTSQAPSSSSSPSSSTSKGSRRKKKPYKRRRGGNQARIIWVTQTPKEIPSTPSPISSLDFLQAFSDALRKRKEDTTKKGQPVETVELVRIFVNESPRGVCTSRPGIQLNRYIRLREHVVCPSNVAESFIDLAMLDLNLSALHISGIPMKTGTLSSMDGRITMDGGPTELHNVTLITPAVSLHSRYDGDEECILGEPLEGHSGTSMTRLSMGRATHVHWRPQLAEGYIPLLSSSRISRVSPHNASCLATQAVLKHVSCGYPMYFIAQVVPPTSTSSAPLNAISTQPPLFMLGNVREDVVVHRLHPVLPMHHIPATRAYTDVRAVDGLNTVGFRRAVEEGIIRSNARSTDVMVDFAIARNAAEDVSLGAPPIHGDPPNASESGSGAGDGVAAGGGRVPQHGALASLHGLSVQVRSTTAIERFTRYVPLNPGDSCLFASGCAELRMLVEPLRQLLLDVAEPSNEDLAVAIEIVNRLKSFTTQCDARLFPRVMGKTELEDAYRSLWKELSRYAALHVVHRHHHGGVGGKGPARRHRHTAANATAGGKASPSRRDPTRHHDGNRFTLKHLIGEAESSLYPPPSGISMRVATAGESRAHHSTAPTPPPPPPRGAIPAHHHEGDARRTNTPGRTHRRPRVDKDVGLYGTRQRVERVAKMASHKPWSTELDPSSLYYRVVEAKRRRVEKMQVEFVGRADMMKLLDENEQRDDG